MLRTSQVSTNLISELFLGAGVVQDLATSIFKSVPNLQVLIESDFRVIVARRCGESFGNFNIHKCPEPLSFWKCANFSTSLVPDPPHPPVLRSWLSGRWSHETVDKQRYSFLIFLLYHICAFIYPGWQTFSNDFQCSPGLQSQTFFDYVSSIYVFSLENILTYVSHNFGIDNFLCIESKNWFHNYLKLCHVNH